MQACTHAHTHIAQIHPHKQKDTHSLIWEGRLAKRVTREGNEQIWLKYMIYLLKKSQKPLLCIINIHWLKNTHMHQDVSSEEYNERPGSCGKWGRRWVPLWMDSQFRELGAGSGWFFRHTCEWERLEGWRSSIQRSSWHQDSPALLNFMVRFSDGLSYFYFQQMEGQLDFADWVLLRFSETGRIAIEIACRLLPWS